jgi:hypothetical protein
MESWECATGGMLLNEPITKALLLSLLLVGTGIYLVNRPVTIRDLERGDIKI